MLIAAGWLSACAVPTLRVGTSGDYPPFSVREEAGSLHGFDVQVARAYARDRRLRLVLVPFRWPELEERLVRGDFDVAMSGVTVRGDRLARAPMTSAVARADAIVLVLEGRGERDLDHEGFVVAVNRGGHLEKLARSRFRRARIRAVDDNRSLADLLARRRVDAVVTDSVEARGFMDVRTRVYETLTHDRKAYWVSPERADLVLDLNQWIGARAANRWLETERSVWLDDPQRPSLPVADAALVDQIGQRLLLMPIVAEAKRADRLPVDAPEREAAIAEAAADAAARAGLDPERYLDLVRAEVAAAKAVQRAVLTGSAAATGGEVPDLQEDLRPAIDRIDRAIRATLVWAAPVRSSEDELVAALRVDADVPGLDDAHLRAIASAARAIPAAIPASH